MIFLDTGFLFGYVSENHKARAETAAHQSALPCRRGFV
jgi:hypothetical protein